MENNRGVLFNSSNNNCLENNTAINNDGAISIWDFSNFNIVRNNKMIVDEEYWNKYGISLIESDGNEIYNNNLLRLDPITLLRSDANKIVNNTANFGGRGINLIESKNNELSRNSISNSGNGIFLQENSSSNKLIDNIIFDNSVGIKLESRSNNNTITRNTLKNSKDIYISEDCNNNNIYKNKIDYSKYLKKPYRADIMLLFISVMGMIYLFILLFRK